MSFELRSDGFGNRIKCIECIKGINNDLLSSINIMTIIGILNDNKGFKQFICDYLLNEPNIDNKILSKLYYFGNQLNINNHNKKKKINNIFALNNDVLTRIVCMLDTKSIINFELTCYNGCYISRQPLCLSNNLIKINAEWKDYKIPKYYDRFMRIQKLQFRRWYEYYNQKAFDFINKVSSNVKYFENWVPLLKMINIDNFKSLEYLYDKSMDVGDEENFLFTYESFIKKLCSIDTLDLNGSFCEDQEIISKNLKLLNKCNEWSLKSLILRTYDGIDILSKVMQKTMKQLQHLQIYSPVFMDIMKQNFRDNQRLSFPNITELVLLETIDYAEYMYTLNEGIINQFRECFRHNKITKLMVECNYDHRKLNCLNMDIYSQLKTLTIIGIFPGMKALIDHIKGVFKYKKNHKLCDKMVVCIYMYLDVEIWNCDRFDDFINVLYELKQDNIDFMEMVLITNWMYADEAIVPKNIEWFKHNKHYNEYVTIYYDNELKDEYKYTTLKNIRLAQDDPDYDGLNFIGNNKF